MDLFGEREEAYIQAVLRICEKEKIDTIFPSFDPAVSLLWWLQLLNLAVRAAKKIGR
jgi:hypothetical protein